MSMERSSSVRQRVRGDSNRASDTVHERSRHATHRGVPNHTKRQEIGLATATRKRVFKTCEEPPLWIKTPRRTLCGTIFHDLKTRTPNHEAAIHLEDTVQGVEGNRRPRRQGFRGVVLVVECVHVLVQELVRVQRPVHPVDLPAPTVSEFCDKIRARRALE